LNFSGFEPGSFRAKVAHLPLDHEASSEDRKKNIGRNPIVDCERNGERIDNNRIEYEMKVQLENGNKSPFTNWKLGGL
jgi:hypothetical protein